MLAMYRCATSSDDGISPQAASVLIWSLSNGVSRTVTRLSRERKLKLFTVMCRPRSMSAFLLLCVFRRPDADQSYRLSGKVERGVLEHAG